ncbi:MAG: hypothetical protein L6Q83_02615 [Gammaproteobacteria bacterium]|nr:hypothetical protein [Gammaproteobacteria bacterium]
MSRPLILNLSAVILAVTDDQPRVLTVYRRDARHTGATRADAPALPSGPLDADTDRTLEIALRRGSLEQTGIEVGYVEQLYTFADRGRDPRERDGGSRLVSVAYLALVREQHVAAGVGAQWQNAYDFLPWEDRRVPGSPAPHIAALAAWSAAAPSAALRRQREERGAISFGLTRAGWDGFQALERYELLYEAGLVAEAWRERARSSRPRGIGRSMALDHRRILATALARVRGKLKYRPVVFELLPPTFTLLQLQRLVEALAGIRLHKQNFRRLVNAARLVEGTGTLQSGSPGRPAELFRFRREVLRERQGPGVRLPGAAGRRAR